MTGNTGRLLAGLALLVLAPAGMAVNVGDYVRSDEFGQIQISPTGDYLAATVPMEDRTALAILRRSDMSVTGVFKPGRDDHAADFTWVNDERVVISIAKKQGSRNEPYLTGELYGMDANGGSGELLVGYRVEGNGLGSRIQPKKAEDVAAFPLDTLPTDRDNILVSVWPFSDEPYTRVDKLDVRSGRRTTVARSPVQRGTFFTDNAAAVRFVSGSGSDNVEKLYYRVGSDWKLVNDEAVTRSIHTPIGFAEDNTHVYLQVDNATGPDSIVRWDPETNERSVVFQDKVADPGRIIYKPNSYIPVGVAVTDGRTRTAFFDPASPEVRMYRSLEAAFGSAVEVTSTTRDGKVLLVRVWSGSNPGDFYVFDTEKKKADHLASAARWIDPDKSAEVTPFSLSARDGLQLHGYLTRPRGSSGALPMVVMPHGGPFQIFDTWGYDRDAQLLAAAGYAVLQVNFRGSANYGRKFGQLGAQQWGGTMQDDVTDATRWAIKEGHAKPDAICIYGASYGGYAALMGVAREPSLYRCAAGYVGVYDLPLMFTRGDTQDRRSGMTYLREWIGDPKDLGPVSPVNLASQIKVPVFLAAGGEDKRAPQLHTERMEQALKKAGVPVESLYYKTEGHGFYTEEHQREYYTRLLAFLARSLGGKTAQAAAPQAAGAGR